MPSTTPMSLLHMTIAIPAFNEEITLEPIVRACLDILDQPDIQGGEVLIVDDGSTDGTRDAAEKLGALHDNVRLHRHQKNRGFAAVQKSCYKQARCDWIFLLPADGQIAPSEINRFLPLCDQYDLMFGATGFAPERGLRGLQTGAYHALVETLFKLRLGHFGSCVMVRRELVQSLRLSSRTPVLMTELAVRARAARARIATIPVDKKPRQHGAAKGGNMLRISPNIAKDLTALYLDAMIRKSIPRAAGEGGS